MHQFRIAVTIMFFTLQISRQYNHQCLLNNNLVFTDLVQYSFEMYENDPVRIVHIYWFMLSLPSNLVIMDLLYTGFANAAANGVARQFSEGRSRALVSRGRWGREQCWRIMYDVSSFEYHMFSTVTHGYGRNCTFLITINFFILWHLWGVARVLSSPRLGSSSQRSENRSVYSHVSL